MTPEVQIELIRNVPSTIAAVGVIIGLYLSYRNGRKINSVHEDVNGKMQELINVSSEKAKAEGVKEEKERDPEK